MNIARRAAGAACTVLVLLALLEDASEANGAAVVEKWKVSSSAVWPPAIVSGKMVLKAGDTLSAHSLDDGQVVWTKTLPKLNYGANVLCGGDKLLYVLSAKGLHVLDPAQGKVVRTQVVQGATSVQCAADSVYVTTGTGLLRFDGSGKKLLAKAKGIVGELRAADGTHAVVYSFLEEDTKTSPKRLLVLDLQTGKTTFEFKLLPSGGHRVISAEEGRLFFIDYSQQNAQGQNPKKLYYTEADYVLGKKLKDVSLGAKYTQPGSDIFWVTRSKTGVVFFANSGSPGDPSMLFAYDPASDKTLWTRSGEVSTMGLLVLGSRLVTGVTQKGGSASLVVYSVEDGNTLGKLPLDSPGTGNPVLAGEDFLVRTKSSVFCFSPKAEAKVGGAAVGGVAGSAPSKEWRRFKDRTVGYSLEVPKTWQFDQPKLKKLGGIRMVSPFARIETVDGKPVYLGSVQILSFEAMGRDAEALWQSVLAQRRQLTGEVAITKKEPVASVGGSGVPGVLVHYTFSSGGKTTELRSLCMVSAGVALELRGWVGTRDPQTLWSEIDSIFGRFKPTPMTASQ